MRGGTGGSDGASSIRETHRRTWEVGLVLLGALIAVITQTFVAPALDGWIHPPAKTIGQQLDALSRAAARHGLQLRTRAVRLRGDERRSWILVGDDPEGWVDQKEPPSDSVSIYDTETSGSRTTLVRHFRFQPRHDPKNLPWVFDVVRTLDVDGDGNTDVIGAFRERTNAHGARVPILIRWDPLSARYEITPLIAIRPHLRRASYSNAESIWQDIGTYRFRLRDQPDHLTVRGFSTNAFDVIPQARNYSFASVVSGYPYRYDGHGVRWQITAFAFDVEHASQYRCATRILPERIGRGTSAGVTDDNAAQIWRRAGVFC